MNKAELGEKIKNYITELNENKENKESESTFEFSQAKKYFKIWVTLCNGQKCIFAFIDENGDIYKPAGVNKPANGIRGNLDEFRPLTAEQLYKRR